MGEIQVRHKSYFFLHTGRYRPWKQDLSDKQAQGRGGEGEKGLTISSDGFYFR